MGYRGKPSASCERCRSRRLKCNYARPSCASCIRAGAVCSGYRDQSDSGFLDQSEEIARNYHRRANKRRPATSPSATAGDLTDASTTPATLTASTPPRTLPASVQDVARCYLFANYMSGGPRTRHMAYLVPLMKDVQNSALDAAVSAVALAAFSNMHVSLKTMTKARVEYSTALSKTNHALRDPVLCKTDDVLAAVIMLGMFELITCIDTSFIDRWANHLDGATKLLEVRGPEQLDSPEGLEMFTQLRAQISISKIYQEKRDAPILASLSEQIERCRPPTDRILDQLGLVVIKIVDFFADVKEDLFIEPFEVIRSALKLDAELVSLLITAPSSWNYRIVHVPTSHGMPVIPQIWGTAYHVYGSTAASSMWNNYRCARILIQELIISILTDINTSTEEAIGLPQQQSLETQCRQTTAQLVDDICASVPYCLGSEIETDLESAVPGSGPASFTLPGSGGLTLIWPLLVAANSGVVSEDRRIWIGGCLDKIGHSTGINQALATSRLLRDRVVTRAWLSPEYDFSTTPAYEGPWYVVM